jgi:hypothetical protein
MSAAGRYLLFFLTLAGYYSVFVLFASSGRNHLSMQQRGGHIETQANRPMTNNTSIAQKKNDRLCYNCDSVFVLFASSVYYNICHHQQNVDICMSLYS